MTDPNTVDPFDVVKCKGCGKDVFPSERLIALKVIWHKGCLKCTTCQLVLNPKTLESFQMRPYCKAHLVNAKTGGGTQTAQTGATNVANQPRATSDTKNWDPASDIAKAKASGYQAPEETRAEHDSQKRRDPKTEVQAAKAKGYVIPEENRAEHDSQKRRDPRQEVAAAKATGFQAPEESHTSHTSQKSWNPQQEIAAARAAAPNPVYDEPPAAKDYQKEQIRGGNVSAAKSKFVAPPAQPAAVPPVKAAPAKKAAPAFAGRAPAAPAAPAPPPPVHHEEPQQQWEEPAPAEEHHQEQPAEQHYEQPAEQHYEQPAEEQHQEQPPAEAAPAAAEGAVWATAVYDYAGEQEGDLQFKAGDAIQVLDQSDPSGWWQGTINNLTGVFPSNFVQLNA